MANTLFTKQFHFLHRAALSNCCVALLIKALCCVAAASRRAAAASRRAAAVSRRAAVASRCAAVASCCAAIASRRVAVVSRRLRCSYIALCCYYVALRVCKLPPTFKHRKLWCIIPISVALHQTAGFFL